MAVYDVIVVGLGGMGSAAAHHLAARGQRVLGLEKFGPAHDRGASHGGSRITRQSYFEGPDYVPLLLRSYELFDQLARDSGTRRDHPDRRGDGRPAGQPYGVRQPAERRAGGACRTRCSTPPSSGAGSRR